MVWALSPSHVQALHKCHTHTHTHTHIRPVPSVTQESPTHSTPTSECYTSVTHTQHALVKASHKCDPHTAHPLISVTQVSCTHSTPTSKRYASVTQHLPCRAPEATMRCNTPQLARQSGSSRKERYTSVTHTHIRPVPRVTQM
jgi:hypothetical protein